MGKKAVEMGRYGASKLMRNKKLQKKAVNYGINKLTLFIQDSVGSAMDQLSTKVRPKKKYNTNRPELDGGNIFDDLSKKINEDTKDVQKYKLDQATYTWNESVIAGHKGNLAQFLHTLGLSNIVQEGGLNPVTAVQKAYEWVAKPAISKSIEADKTYSRFKKDREPLYKNAYEAVKRLGYNKNFLTFVLSLTNKPLPNLRGGRIPLRQGLDGLKSGLWYQEPATQPKASKKRGKGVDIHKAILKVAPRKGFVLPGHKYTRPGNPLESQLKYDP